MSNTESIDDWTWNLVKDEYLAKWMAGFFDGEGMVRVKIIKRKRQRTGYEMTVRAEIEQKYVAGIFDAEGSIQTSISPSEYGDVSYNVGTRADIGLGEFPDTLQEVISEYCNTVNVDENYYDKNGGDMIRMMITGRDDVYRFLEGIQPYSIIKQPQIEIMLNSIIPMMEEGMHLNKKGFLEMMEKVDEMNSYKGGNRGKYTLEYFEDEWLDDNGEWKVEVGESSSKGRNTSSRVETSTSLERFINGEH